MKIGDYDFPEDLYYEKNHFWAKDDGSGNVTIGATDFFQQLAGEIVYIELPMEGTKVEQGRSFSSLESGKWVGPLKSPVAGEIVEVNQEVLKSPSLINEDPYGAGWVAVISASDLEADMAGLIPGSDKDALEAWLIEEKAKHT